MKHPNYWNIQLGPICTCHSCHTPLVTGLGVNAYSGGPFQCGRCGADVTEDVYGPTKPKETESSEQNKAL